MEEIGVKQKTRLPNISFPLHIIRGIEFWIVNLSGWYWIEKDERWIKITNKDIVTYFVLSLNIPTERINNILYQVIYKRLYRPKNWRVTKRYVKFRRSPQNLWIRRVKWELWYAEEVRKRDKKVREMLITLFEIPAFTDVRKHRNVMRKSSKSLLKVFGTKEKR